MRKLTLSALFLFVTVSTSAYDQPIHFGFHVGYSPSYLTIMNTKTTVNGSSTSDSLISEYERKPEYGITIWSLPKNNWGFQLAADYGAKRKLKKVTYEDGTTFTPTATTDVPTYQTHFIRFGTSYRWEYFYVPVGLSYSFSSMTVPNSGTLAVKGGPGIYLGLGWTLTDNIAIEYISRSTLTEYKYTAGTVTETGTGVVGSALLNLKILF